MGSIAVVVGGGPLDPLRPPFDGPFDLVIAADSGIGYAWAVGLRVDLLVGDLDSVSSEDLAAARAAGIEIDEHPADKDATDTTLAFAQAVRRADGSTTDLVVLGPGTMDRLDHQLGTIVALGDDSLAVFERVTARLGNTVVHAIHPGHRVRVDMATGEVFSLLALHGPCSGIDVSGARWPLKDARLAAASTLGISNESLGNPGDRPVEISVADGVVTVVRPPAPLAVSVSTSESTHP